MPTFSFIKSNAVICGLFLLLGIVEIPTKAFFSFHPILIIIISTVSLAYVIFTLYLTPGFLSLIWNNFIGNKKGLSNIFTESKKYFYDYFCIVFSIGVISIVSWFISRYLIGKIFFPDIELHLYDETNAAIIISQILWTVSGLFIIFSCSLIYAKNYSGLKSIRGTIYCFRNHIAEFRPILFLIIIELAITSFLSKLYYYFNENWGVEIIRNSVWSIFEILIFLVTCQIIYNNPILNEKQ